MTRTPRISVIGDLPGFEVAQGDPERVDLVVAVGTEVPVDEKSRLAGLGVPVLHVDIEDLGQSWRTAALPTSVPDRIGPELQDMGGEARPESIVDVVVTGVPVYGELAPSVRDRLGGELSGLIRPTPPPEDEIELLGVRQRRAALRGHSREERTDRLLELADRPRHHDSVSVILASNRPDRLPKAIRAVAAQRYGNLELLIGTHGYGATPEVSEAVEQCGFRSRLLEFEPDVVFGDVLQELSVQADGRLLAKVDDDDFYGADHVLDLVVGWRATGSQLVGKAAEFVYVEDQDLTLRRIPGSGGWGSTWLAGGALMMTVEGFRAAGGWRPLRRHVDEALIEDVLALGGSTYGVPGFAYMLNRHGAHTWSKDDSSFLLEADDRWKGWRGDLADVVRYDTP